MPDQDRGVLDDAVGVLSWLNRTGWDIARRLPGDATAERTVRPVEELVAGQVRRQLQSMGLLDRGPVRRELTGSTGTRWVDGQVTTAVRPRLEELDPLRAAMAELLSRSAEQTREQSERQLFAGLLRQLVPDEARILAALSDGTRYPVVHVASRGPFGGIKRLVLENASTVGRAAGVQLAAHTPTLLSHLIRLGLVDVDPEDRSLAEQYDILLTDELVRAAEAEARVDGRGGVRVIRQTVALSELGRRFWQACQPVRATLPARWP